jgi:hypothetical protein
MGGLSWADKTDKISGRLDSAQQGEKSRNLIWGAEILQTCVGNRGTGTLEMSDLSSLCPGGTASVSFPDPVLSL